MSGSTPESAGLSSNWKKLQDQLRQDKKASKRKAGDITSRPKDQIKRTKLAHEEKKTGTARKTKSAQTKDDEIRADSSSKASTSASAVASQAQIQSRTSAQSYPDVPNQGMTPSLSPGKYIALDCEMVGVGPVPEESSMLARASLVDYNGTQLYDTYVLAKEPVTDYRTHVSGITPALIRPGSGARSFEHVQQDVASLLEGRILVGHAIHNDLKALMLKHPRQNIRDTSALPKFREVVGSKRPSLRELARVVLGMTIQSGQHSSVEDARVTMALFRTEKRAFEAQALSRAAGGSNTGSIRPKRFGVGRVKNGRN